ncbi:PREDICTED: uncharacterized protein LOC101294805 isoform X3 [Fragaria vesca subsp. vesca]|uniref:uncharacterized protein LOC101294805 isoform X3 n=1 Tax=Fragaria vesca subsp. vesca TaxID=101020 RepID=UPI0002C2E72E|nr:PREDICTED: uncharacterized protein LOC101294805 isoform X3 [Fragaria vesca subsp. vesca]
MTEVGEDLVEKILATLPPKALMRFKCASKRWYPLINNPSIASVLGDHKLERRDNFSVANFSPLTDSLSSPSIMDLEWNSYSIWAIPMAEVSLRIKKVMEGLKTEFGGPEIEPHIPVIGSICTTDEDVLDEFRSLCSKNFHAYQAKVSLVVTTNFYHQCVSLLIDTSSEASSQMVDHI